MIDLSIIEESQTNLFQEDLRDSLNTAAQMAGADTDSIGDTLTDPDSSMYDKIKSINDDGVGEVRKTTDSIDKILSKNVVDTRSIVARARNSVLQFPIYVPQTIRINEAHIIGKMFERVYATLVQTVLSQNPVMDEEEANNLVFLKKFHTNLKEAADVLVNKYYEPIDSFDEMMQDSIFYSQRLSENCVVEFSVIPTTDKELIMENARLINEPLTGISYLKEDTKRNESEVNKKTTFLSENELKEIAAELANLTSRERSAIETSEKDINASSTDKTVVNSKLKEKRNAEDKMEKSLKDLKEKIKSGKMPGYTYSNGKYSRELSDKKSRSTISVGDSSRAVDAPKLLHDTDIKKFNGLLPYSIEVTFRLHTKQGLDRDVKYVIGVKTVMHLFRTQDLSEDLRDLVMGKIKSLQKVRYKTGEINFKDYLFNIKNLKADAAKNINYNKRWINTLKRLSDYRSTYGSVLKKPVQALAKGDVPIPNGTLILSQPDVVTLTSQTGIDLSVVSNAKKLARSLFLIAVVIVDSSAGTMRVLFTDSDNEWDVQSLASIDAELSKTDNSQLMKELNRMVNK